MELTSEERDLLLAIVRCFIATASNEFERSPTCPSTHLTTEMEAEEIVRGYRPPHPAVYVPDDPTWVVGVLGKDCPDGYEFTYGRCEVWVSAGRARATHDLYVGMIRPAPRPEVVVSIPADLAELYAADAATCGDIDAMRDVIRAARDEVSP